MEVFLLSIHYSTDIKLYLSHKVSLIQKYRNLIESWAKARSSWPLAPVITVITLMVGGGGGGVGVGEGGSL